MRLAFSTWAPGEKEAAERSASSGFASISMYELRRLAD
jgi:hypothetical protein